MNHPEKYNQITKNALNAMINKKESEFVFKNGNHISRNLTKDSSIFAKDKKIPVIVVPISTSLPSGSRMRIKRYILNADPVLTLIDLKSSKSMKG